MTERPSFTIRCFLYNATLATSDAFRQIPDGDFGRISHILKEVVAKIPTAPVSTYRVQLHRGFAFRDAAELVDYFADLGISHLYLSPILEARPGSAHGYDVVDPTRVNPELGGEEGLQILISRLRDRGIEVLLDIVPNHMCVAGGRNRWWNDVLQHGRSSPFAHYFDIDWEPGGRPDLEGKVLLPVLGSSLETTLRSSKLRIVCERGTLSLAYYDHRFPLAPRSCRSILQSTQSRLDSMGGAAGSDEAGELRTITEKAAERPTAELASRLAKLVETPSRVRDALGPTLDEINDDPSQIEAILSEQAYLLSDWREANRALNYRRFFQINELAGLRIEDDEVYQAVHRLVLRLVEQNSLAGLRVDHIDGLRDPLSYLRRLPDTYVVVEKILEQAEPLTSGWPVAGTTGYDFLNSLNGIFVDPDSETVFRQRYTSFSEVSEDFDEIVYRSKKQVVESSFESDLNRLARLLSRSHDESTMFSDLVSAVGETVSCFPVYRTYIRPSDSGVDRRDQAYVKQAVLEAERRTHGKYELAFGRIRETLLLRNTKEPIAREFILRFQQLTGAVMAKGFEDTALYRYYPLVSLNEVGGNPSQFGVSQENFHRQNQERMERWPGSMLASSTHDTKRDEDVRARVNVLSEIPGRWWRTVSAWHALNEEFKTRIGDRVAPDANEEYLLYQTIVGTWGLETVNEAGRETYTRRLRQYMLKAIREAKANTGWIEPNEAYEDAVLDFTSAVLERSKSARFLDSLDDFVKTIRDAGPLSSASAVLLKIGSPGVPDFYQGTELPECSLVDPDNRRPVDFGKRKGALASIPKGAVDRAVASAMLTEPTNGTLKLHVTHRGLRFRREHAALVSAGSYSGLSALGDRENHVVAFARTRGENCAVFLGTRFFTKLPSPPTGDCWRGTVLPLEGLTVDYYHDVLTGRRVRVHRGASGPELALDEVFADFPFAILEASA